MNMKFSTSKLPIKSEILKYARIVLNVPSSHAATIDLIANFSVRSQWMSVGLSKTDISHLLVAWLPIIDMCLRTQNDASKLFTWASIFSVQTCTPAQNVIAKMFIPHVKQSKSVITLNNEFKQNCDSNVFKHMWFWFCSNLEQKQNYSQARKLFCSIKIMLYNKKIYSL